MSHTCLTSLSTPGLRLIMTFQGHSTPKILFLDVLFTSKKQMQRIPASGCRSHHVQSWHFLSPSPVFRRRSTPGRVVLEDDALRDTFAAWRWCCTQVCHGLPMTVTVEADRKRRETRDASSRPTVLASFVVAFDRSSGSGKTGRARHKAL